jgi:putative ABC transport system permease protein
MSWMRYLRRRSWDRERALEIRAYLETETADNIARGMTPADAASAAHRKFGNPTLVREEIYRMNTISWLESIVQDLRHGMRTMIANRGFSLIAILSLALGIGANTAIFQLLNAVRLRSLPIEKPQELAQITIAGGNNGMGLIDDYRDLTRPMWEQIRRNHPAFSGVFAWSTQGMSVGEGKDFQHAAGIVVSGEFFRVLGIQPYRGRLLESEDEQACPGSAAVVSHTFWQSKLGSQEIRSNTKLFIQGRLRQVVGVTPPSFPGLEVGERFDIALPACMPKQLRTDSFEVVVMGRLKPGWTQAQASAQLAGMSPALMAATEITGYDSSTVQRYRKFQLFADPAAHGVSKLRDAYDSSLWMLLAITGLVLLIACANLANLMLARAATREREIAVRLALGAARGRVLRQLLVESSLLAGIGAALGIAVAEFLSRALVLALSNGEDDVALAITMDWRVLLFAAAVATATCLVFGIVPAFRASAADPVTAMKSGGRGTTTGRERFSFQRAMVVAQISVSLVLLTGALLFVRSFHNLMTFDPGMRESGITVAFIGFDKSNIPPDRIEGFKRQLVEEVRSIPGVLNAAATTHVPLIGGAWNHQITIGKMEGGAMFTWASPNYFETMGIPLLSGRGLAETDTAASQRVAVVNQTFVRRFLSNSDPMGQTMRTHPEPGYPSTVYQIVGVMADSKYQNLRDEVPPFVIAPSAQLPSPGPGTAMTIYSNLPAPVLADSVKRRIAEKHPEIVVQCRTFQDQIRSGMVRERLMALLSGFFGLLAVLLGTIGLYGVISYLVTQRRNEIGIRVALGASRGQVIGMILREAGWLLIIGVTIGVGLSLAAGRAAESLLFGLKPSDPLTLVSATGLLIAIGALASFLPARRAAQLDPMNALRSD